MKPSFERKITMKNYRSTKLIAWLLTIIMIFNIAPISAIADEYEAGTGTPGVITTINLNDAVVKSEDGTLSFDLTKIKGLPEDTSLLKMEYTPEKGTTPTAPSGTGTGVNWKYDSSTNKITFSWAAESQNSFSAKIACDTVPEPSSTQYVVKHVRTYPDNSTYTEYETYTYGQDQYWSALAKNYKGFQVVGENSKNGSKYYNTELLQNGVYTFNYSAIVVDYTVHYQLFIPGVGTTEHLVTGTGIDGDEVELRDDYDWLEGYSLSYGSLTYTVNRYNPDSTYIGFTKTSTTANGQEGNNDSNNQQGNNGQNDQQNQQNNTGSEETEEFTVRYVIPGKDVYTGTYVYKNNDSEALEGYLPNGRKTSKDQDFVVLSRTVTDANHSTYKMGPAFDNENFASWDANTNLQNYSSDSVTWDENKHVLTFWLKIKTDTSGVVHYRYVGRTNGVNIYDYEAIYTFQNAISQMTGKTDSTLSEFEGKTPAPAISFLIPDEWIDVGEGKTHALLPNGITYMGYSYSELQMSDIEAGNYSTGYDIEWNYYTKKDVYQYYRDKTSGHKDDMTLTAVNYNGVYDGATHNGGYTIDVEGADIQYSVDGGATWSTTVPSIENVGTQEYKVKATKEGYNEAIANGTLTITPAGVMLTADSDTKTYNGSEQTVAGFTSSVEGLTFAETVTASGAGTNAGTYDVTFSGVTVNETKDTTGNYVVTGTTDGTLTINPAGVTLTANSDTKTYNGSEQTVTGYTSSVEGLTFAETVTASGAGTNAGTYDVTFSGVTVNKTKDTTGNYVVTGTTNGTLTINPTTLIITITGDKKEFSYDGTAKTASGYTATSENTLFDASKIVFTGKDSVTETAAGTYPMGLAAGQFSYNDANFEDVTFSVTDGELKINKATLTITITGDKKEYTYDGTAKTASGYTATSESTLFDTSKIVFTSKDSVTETAAGTYPMGLAAGQFSYNDANFEDVTFSVTDGELKINKATLTITITGDKKEYTYDGTAKTASGYTATSESTLFDESKIIFTGTASVTETVAGTYPMGLAAGQFSYDDANFENVIFSVTDGSLEIKKKDVKISADNKTKVYDNDVYTDPKLTATVNGAVAGETINYTLTRAEGQDANSYKITVVPGENPNYTVTVADGTFTITPAAITIKADNKTKVYDHDASTDPGLTATLTGVPANGVAPVYSLGRAEGQEAADYVISVTANTESNPNYTVTVNSGTFSITPKPVTITVDNASKTYGETDPVFTGSVNGLIAEGDLGTITYSRTNADVNTAGTYDNVLIAGYTANSNYSVTVVPGDFTINKLSDVVVTITGHNNTTDYDGAAHSVSGYDITSIKIGDEDTTLYTAEDFTFSGTASAARTDAGTTYMDLAAEQFTNQNKNFENVTFNIVDGYQAINQVNATVTITGHYNTTDYDGTAHTVTGYDVAISTPLYTQADFSAPSASVSRTDVGTAYMGLSAESFENNNTNFGTVTFIVTDGYQKIEPISATVTITEHSDEADYDGTEHTVTGYDVTSIRIGDEVTTLYTADDFTFTGNASVSGTDAGSYDMELSEDNFANTNNNFTDVRFVIVDGQLTIKPIDVTVTITGRHDSKTYDGAEHSIRGYDTEISNTLYKATDFTFSGEALAKGTTVGTYMMGLKSSQFTNSNANFGTVTFNVTDGYQEIVPVDEVVVTITGRSNTTDYDGQAHSVKGYEVDISNPLYTEADFSFTPAEDMAADLQITRTDAGKTEMGLMAEQFANKNENFKNVTFNVTDGYQAITPISATVTITENSDKVDYDGSEHTVTGYTATTENTLYDVDNDFTFSGTASVSGTNAGSYDMELTAADFTNTNKNFNNVTFVVVDGQLVVDPIIATVTIAEHGDEADYDGEAHTVTGYDVTSIKVNGADTTLYTVNDFSFSGNASASGTSAGSYDMELTADDFTNNNTNFKTVSFVIADGQMVIKPIDATVTIVGANNTTDYDGKEHGVSGYAATASTGLYDVDKDFTFSGTQEAKRTDAGKTDMGLKANQFVNTNPNFRTVTFNVTDGYQAINKINTTVTIVGAYNTTDYDGTEHGVSGYTATASTSLYDVTKDFTFGGTKEAKRTDAGKTGMGLAAEQFTNTNTNFETVTFDVTDGYQEIKPIDVTVTITEHSGTEDYNGTEQKVNGYDVEISNPLYTEDDFTFNGTAVASGTNAGTYPMELKAEDFENTNTNFGTVTFSVVDGSLVIKPINVSVKITGHNGTVPYDGDEHKVTGYDVEISNSLYKEADFTFSGTAEAARTDAGKTEMGLAAEQFANTNTNFGTVTFDVTDGYQEIKPISATVTITGHHNATTYDGTEHSVSGYDVEIDNKLYAEGNFNFNSTAVAARTEEGTTEMGLAADQFENTSDNFENVTFNVTDGYQTITALEDVVVTITGHNNTTSYDGNEHSVTGYDVEISNPLYTTADFTFSGKAAAAQTDKGTAKMGLNAGQFTNTNGNFANVTFNVTDGYQTITPITATVTITGHNNTAPYDGTEHSVSGYEVEISNPLYTTADFTFSGAATAAQTNAGTDNMGLKAEQFNNTNGNFEGVTFNVTDGYQTITPIKATVTITERSGKADYDGEEHTVAGYDVTGIQVNDTDTTLYSTTDFTFTGDASVSGMNAGSYDMELTADDFTNNNTNFETVTFKIVDGTLEISPIDVKVTIVGESDTRAYDGSEHKVSGYTATADSKLYDTEKDFSFNGTDTAAQTNAGTTKMKLADEQFINNNKNFNVTFDVTDGYQTIEKVGVTVTADDKERTSRIAESEEPELTAKVEGLVNDEPDSLILDLVKLSREQGEKLHTPGEYAIKPEGPEETDNYVITYVNGKMTITDVSDPLYNFALIYRGDKEVWHRLKKQDNAIITELQLSEYIKKIPAGKTQIELESREYELLVPEYDFSGYTVEFDGREYYYSEDGKPNQAHPTSSYYTVEHGYDFMVAVKNKISGGNLWLNQEEDYYTDPTGNKDSFHRNYTITLYDAVTVVANDKELVYNSKTQNQKNSYKSYVTDKNGNRIEVKPSFNFQSLGEGKDVGEYKITFTDFEYSRVVNNGKYNKFYAAANEDGTLTITPKELTITAKSSEFTYNGNAQSDSKWNQTGLQTNDKLSVKVTGSITNVEEGTVANVVESYEFTAGKAENYKITTVNGRLTMLPRSVTITTGSSSKTYDGEPLTNSTAKISGLVNGEKATVTATGTITDPGTAVNTYSIDWGTTKARNYTVTEDLGTLAVTKNETPIIITAASDSKTYDGTALTNAGYTFTENVLAEGDVLTATVEGTITDYGTTENVVTGYQVMRGKTDVTANYTFGDSVDGTLEIAKRTVTLTSADGEKVYDGQALTKNAQTDMTVGGDGFADGEGAVYSITGSQTDEGSSANAFTYTLNEGTKADNYTITTAEGTLKVTPVTDTVTVTITENSGSEKYDGTEKTVTGYTVTSIDNTLYTEADFSFSGDATVKGTDAGSYDMKLTAADFANTSKNFTNVAFVIVDGTLEIAKRTVTLTSADGEKVYDGQALTKNAQTDMTVGGDGFADGEGAVYSITGSQTDEGSSANAFTYTLNEGTKADNYTITTAEGTLKVTPVTDTVTVTITENSGSEKYDGTEKTVTGYTVTSIDNTLYTEADFSFSGDATVKGTDAGSYDMKLTAADFANTSKNFTNVAFVIVDGTLEIAKRTVTLTSADGEKVYDRTALTNDTVTVTGDGFVEDEGATCTVTGSQTEVGSSANAFTYTLNEGTKADNYDIGTVEGTLEITPYTTAVTVTITEHGDEVKYDGEEHTVIGYDVAIDDDLYTEEDFSFSGDATVKGTDAGSYDMELTATDFTNTNTNFENVTFVIADGTLEIAKRTVTLTSADDEKVYDRTALTNDTVTVTGDGFVEGEGATYTVTGSQMEAGSSENAFTYTLNEGTKADNYEIETVEGTLEITPYTAAVTITITEHSGRYTYDAAAHTVSGYDVAISDPLYTEADFTFSGTASVTGTNAGTYAMTLSPENFTNTNANFGNVTFVIVDGILRIDPKTAVITANSSVKTYGDADPTMTFATEGLAGRDYIAASLSRVAGEDIGTYTINASPVANPNYVIETVDGTMTIEPRRVNVAADNKIKVYGNDDPAMTAVVTGLAAGDGKDLIAYTLTRASGEGVGDYAIDASGDAAQGNYIVTYDPAILTIVPEDTVVVIITANNGTFQYDGQEKDLSGYTVTISNPLYTEADFTFSGNSDLKGVNAGTYRTAMKAADFANTNTNFENVVFQVENGQLEITRRHVTLTSADAEKPYDGTALTNNMVDIGGDGFVEGEGVNLIVTGRIVPEGTAENTFTYTMANGTAAENYDIKTAFGTLTVTKGLMHRLTINYVDDQGKQIQKSFTREYAYSEAYSVASAKISGYQADIEAVNGIMGEEDVEVTVVYKPINYTLTVRFTSVTDGKQAADPMKLQLKSGDSYVIFVPKTEGYTSLVDQVTGKMPSSDREITVFMMPDDATEAQRNNYMTAIEIEDYGTPLGVADSILGGGEIIE